MIFWKRLVFFNIMHDFKLKDCDSFSPIYIQNLSFDIKPYLFKNRWIHACPKGKVKIKGNAEI